MRRALFVVVFFTLLFVGVFGVDAQGGLCENYCKDLNQGLNPGPLEGVTCICNPLQTTNLAGIVDSILTVLFNFAIILAPLMIVIAGIMFVTAAGNPDQVSRAKRILLWTGVGFIVILLARGLIVVLQRAIGF